MLFLFENTEFLLFALSIMWSFLLVCAIMRRESIKWILSVQTAVSIMYAIAWLHGIHLSNPYAINNLSCGVGVLCFFAELFLLAYQHRHRRPKQLCVLAIGASILHIIAHFLLFIIIAAIIHC